MAIPSLSETDLYLPVKSLLEGQGYAVKGEIGAADLVAVRDEENPVIVELKTAFSLSLIHQGIERQALSDSVYVCVPRGRGRPFLKALKRNTSLCRRLGLGLMTVRMKDGFVEIHCDPGPYKPRQSKRKKARLLKEFAKRTGDPNKGGATRQGLMTAYRQDALRCLALLQGEGPLKASIVRDRTGVEKARELMAANHYGWFETVERGIYQVTPNGQAAVATYALAISELKISTDG